MIRIMILATITLILGLLPSCGKDPDPNENCTKGSNSAIWHKCINIEINKSGAQSIDLNDDGKYDFGIQMTKDVHNNQVVSNIGYLTLVDVTAGSSGGLHFDYYAEKKKLYADSSYVPIRVNEGFQVDSSIYSWMLRLTHNEPNAVLYTYGDLTPFGQNVIYSGGLIDLNNFFIAFRYYDTDKDPKGWKNGWIKLNVTKDRIIIREIAYHKIPETKIKVGEK